MHTARLALVAGCLLLASLPRHALAADIPGIVSTPGEGLQESAGAESEDTISCLAVIYPYSTWQPSLNSTKQTPSTSPPPTYIEGSIDFALVNLGSNPIEAPWTLGVYNPLYTQVLQVISSLCISRLESLRPKQSYQFHVLVEQESFGIHGRTVRNRSYFFELSGA